jgi:hypothetical protein
MGKSGGRKKKANVASGEGSTKLDPDDAVRPHGYYEPCEIPSLQC